MPEKIISNNSPTIRKPKLTMGERFKDARIVHNQHGKQSTDAVAKAVGTSKSTLSDIENDRRDPGAEIICKLAKHYGVSTDYLLGLSDIKTPETTAQAVISYTGLSEENVKTLHSMAQNLGNEIVTRTDDSVIYLDGNKPFLDCLNDLLEAVYSDREAMAKHYIRLRRKTRKNDAIDFWYVMGKHTGPIPGLEPNEYTDWKKQVPFDNETVEFDCVKISKMIESSFIKKYVATQEEIEQQNKEIDELMSKYNH